MAEETLSPGQHELLAQVIADFRYEGPLVIRAGKLDEALLRGRSLAANPSPRIRELKLAKGAPIYEQSFKQGEAGTVKRSSIYGLSQAFDSGPMRLLLKWRHGASSLAALLSRPVEGVIYIR